MKKGIGGMGSGGRNGEGGRETGGDRSGNPGGKLGIGEGTAEEEAREKEDGRGMEG